MLPNPRADLVPNTLAYESEPLVKATGFREYDARWLYGPEINLLGVQALGLGLGTYIQEQGHRKIVVGHDYRSYSLSIKQAWRSRRWPISPSSTSMRRASPWSPPATTRTAGRA
jgi:phosphomannomutase / phosphoglucomutase